MWLAGSSGIATLRAAQWEERRETEGRWQRCEEAWRDWTARHGPKNLTPAASCIVLSCFCISSDLGPGMGVFTWGASGSPPGNSSRAPAAWLAALLRHPEAARRPVRRSIVPESWAARAMRESAKFAPPARAAVVPPRPPPAGSIACQPSQGQLPDSRRMRLL